jgi:hypothetical protein
MAFVEAQPVEVVLDRNGEELLVALLPELRALGRTYERLTLSRTLMRSLRSGDPTVYVVAADGSAVAVVDRHTLAVEVRRRSIAWHRALGASALSFLSDLGSGETETGTGLAPAPKGARISGPDPRAAEEELKALSRERDELQAKVKGARSEAERANLRERLKWVDEVMQATSCLELAD